MSQTAKQGTPAPSSSARIEVEERKPCDTVDYCIVTRRVDFDGEEYQDDEESFPEHWRRKDSTGKT